MDDFHLYGIVRCSILMFVLGTTFFDSIQFAAGPLLFETSLCLSYTTSNILLATAGPIAGFLVQPIVGAFSDNLTIKFGRRRIFVIIGTIGSIISLLGTAFAQKIGSAVGDLEANDCSKQSKGHAVGLGIAISCLWLMNISVNTLMGPARAIINDLVQKDYLVTANSIATAVMAFAAIAANIVGGLFYAPSSSSSDFFHNQPVLLLFTVGAVYMAISSTITIIFAKEHQHTQNPDEPPKTILGTFYDIYRGFRYMPKPLFLVAVLFFLSWAAFSPLMINHTSYYEKNVYGKNYTIIPRKDIKDFLDFSNEIDTIGFRSLQSFDIPNTFPELSPAPTPAPTPTPTPAPFYTPATDEGYISSRRGQSMGMFSLAIFAGVQFLYSLVSPKIYNLIGAKFAYLIPQLLATVVYVLAPIAAKDGYHHWPVPVIVMLLSFAAPNFMAFNSIPFALVSSITEGASGGLYMGVLNAASVVAQFNNMIAGVIANKLPHIPINTKPVNPGWSIAYGGIFSLIACVWCIIFINNDIAKKPSEDDESVSEKKPLIQSEDDTSLPSYQ